MSTSNNNTFEFDIFHNGEFKLNPITYEHGSLLNIIIPVMDFQEMVTYITTKLTSLYYKTVRVHGLYYALPPNNKLEGMKRIKTDYDINVMYDIAKVYGKIQLFVSHHQIDLSLALVPDYDGSMEDAFSSIISEETKMKQQEALSYLHQTVQRKNKRFDYYDYLYKTFGVIRKQKPATPYTQKLFSFLVHNNGELVIDDTSKRYINGATMNIEIPRMKLHELIQYLLNIVGNKINALYYEVPHTGFGFSSTVKLRNNYDMHVMFDISASQGSLEIYIDHVGVNFIIAKYICPNASVAEMMQDVITDYVSDNEEGTKERTTNDYTYDQMVEWGEQEHFENEENKALEHHRDIWKNRMY